MAQVVRTKVSEILRDSTGLSWERE